METAGQPQSAQLPPVPNIPNDMSALFWSLCGAVHLAPTITGHVINYECLNKADSDNYRVYAGHIRGKMITDGEWKDWCSFSGSRLQNATNPSKLDMTALNCLLDAFWKVRKEVEIIRGKGMLRLTYVHDRPMEASSQTDDIPGLLSVDEAAKKNRPFSTTGERKATARSITTPGQSPIQIQLKNYKTVRNVSVQAQDITWVVHEVKNVKNIRNAIVHSEAFARDPATFGQVVSALKLVICETRESYCLSVTQVQKLEKELDDEINHMSSLNKTALSYVCAALLSRGREQTKGLWEQKFTNEQLMFNTDKVKRQAVFHALEVMLRNERNRNVLPYTKLLEATEQFIVVSGLAGSGKTTLLKNMTIQFFKLHQTSTDYLKAFSLLVYIDCKDRTAKTLSEVIEQQFEDLCLEFTTELVVAALFRLDVLFLVDAFDEANPISMTILQELVKKAWRINCRVLFTSRPQSAKLLCQLLLKNDAGFTEYEILPLEALKDKLVFLERLGNHLDNAEQSKAMQHCFSKLNREVREMFTEPINLVLFCHLFRYLPRRIPQLQNPAQVAQEVFVLYRTLIEEKLSDSGYADLNVVIDDQFLIVGELALQLLGAGALTFTEDEFLNLQRLCKNKLNSDIDTQVFLSVVLKLHRPLTGKGSISWTFHHKTLQERFAARYVVKKIKDTKEPVEKILGATKTSSTK